MVTHVIIEDQKGKKVAESWLTPAEATRFEVIRSSFSLNLKPVAALEMIIEERRGGK